MTRAFPSTWRSVCGTYKVSITQASVAAMKRLASAHLPKEVGTSLAGNYSDDGYVATVTRLAPQSADSHGARFVFHRGARGLFEFFREIFAASGGFSHYVGEWHSHPGGSPWPSTMDDENMLAIARDPKSKCPECILVILAIDGGRIDLGVFVYSRRRSRVELFQVPATRVTPGL